MSTEPLLTDSTKLIRCSLINKDNKLSVRFVEMDHYRLWSYMITQKHGFTIKDTFLSLWVKENIFYQKQDIYSRYGDKEKMNLISMMLYDDVNGFSFNINRYILEAETEIMIKVLSSHVREELVINNSFDMQVYPGFCITNQKPLDKLVLGLSSDQIF